MASSAEWVEGARLRTLPAALAPVLAGTGVAAFYDGLRIERALLALVVALALQVGVNYANDYSDGIRGTDSDERRVGPLRLVGSGAATPLQVKTAAFACFGLACAAGLALVALAGAWWLLLVGVACVLAAWFYTGGKRPYGYMGLGEVFVFVFFGLVATCGTTYTQLLSLPAASGWAGVFTGALACAVLVANNLRDIAGDPLSGKHTLAVRLGDANARRFYASLVIVAAVSLIAVACFTTPWALLALLGLALIVRPLDAVLSGASGRALIAVLKFTGLAELAAAALLCVVLVLA